MSLLIWSESTSCQFQIHLFMIGKSAQDHENLYLIQQCSELLVFLGSYNMS